MSSLKQLGAEYPHSLLVLDHLPGRSFQDYRRNMRSHPWLLPLGYPLKRECSEEGECLAHGRSSGFDPWLPCARSNP